MTQMFNIIYRWPSFGGPQNTLGLRISWETSAILSPVPGCSLLPRCPREVWEKGAREIFSRWRHLKSRERLGLRLYFLWIRVYCCCCRRCYCWWCLLSYWGRAKSQGRLVTRVVGVQKLIGFFALELANSLPLLIATIRVVDHPLNNPNIFTNLSFLHVIIL